MAKSKGLESLAAEGRELPGDDLSNDFDPMEHEHADTPLEELEKIIDNDLRGSERDKSLIEYEDEVIQRGFGDEATDDEEPQAAEEGDEEAENRVEEKPAAEEEPAEAVEEPTESERLSALERQLEIQRIENERIRAEAERQELLAQREAGQKGSLMQKLEQLERRLSAPEAEDGEYEPAVAQRQTAPQLPQDLRSELDEIRQERVQRAIENEGRAFLTDPQVVQYVESLHKAGYANGEKVFNGEEAAQAFHSEIAQIVQRDAPGVKEALYGGNPKVSAKLARSLLRTAYAEARIRQLEHHEALARAAKKASDQAIVAKKRGSGTAKSRPASGEGAKKFDPMSASLEELEKRINRDFGVDEGAGKEFI